MPIVLKDGPYDFVFFSSDEPEPRHIHVKRERMLAKFRLEPVAVEKNWGFRQHEWNRIERLVIKHRLALIEAWNDYFGTGE